MIVILIRAVAYAAVFVGIVLVYLPARALSVGAGGVPAPVAFGWPQLAGAVTTAAGATLALWCILSFVVIGRGTPAPFDPPRRLVARGPYRHVRNPMYLGGALALGGAALFYESGALLAYGVAFLVAMHAFVVLYEEPTLRRTFGAEYDAYCRAVRRWRPAL